MFGDKVVPKVFRCGTGRVVRKIGANTGAFSLTHTCIEVRRTVVAWHAGCGCGGIAIGPGRFKLGGKPRGAGLLAFIHTWLLITTEGTQVSKINEKR